jgi:hypothetical protein
MVGQYTEFSDIALVKQQIADFLDESVIYPEICENHSILLNQESALWYEMEEYFKVFMRRGKHLSNFRANYLMDKLEEKIDEIISIQQQIIDDTGKFLHL